MIDSPNEMKKKQSTEQRFYDQESRTASQTDTVTRFSFSSPDKSRWARFYRLFCSFALHFLRRGRRHGLPPDDLLVRVPGSLAGGFLIVVTTILGCGYPHTQNSSPHKTSESGARGQGASQSSSFVFNSQSHKWLGASPPVYRNGEESGNRAILESLGGGVGVLDFDRDGWLDMVFPGGGQLTTELQISGFPTRVWRGLDSWSGIECTANCGVSGNRAYSHGVAVADVDDDGFPDLAITGYQGLQFWKNQGDGTFRDSTTDSGLDADELWSTSAAWGDLNADGLLDLYVAHYVDWSPQNHPSCPNSKHERDVCPPRQFSPLKDEAFLGNGDGTFRSGGVELGLSDGGKGLGVLIADIDGDNRLDVYVANDTTANFLYRSQTDGTLLETGMISGVALSDMGTPDGSMGLSLGDFDLDGRQDLWVANYERELFALYRNRGAGLFHHSSQSMGIAALGAAYVGFGTVAGDFDLDGDEDLVVSNGHVHMLPVNSPVRQRPLLLSNESGKRLVSLAIGTGDYFETDHIGRGLASADFDRDGDLDLVSTPTNEAASVLENISPRSGHSLRLTLVATATGRDAIGAMAILRTAVGPRVRQVISGGSYLSQSERTLTWGIVDNLHPESLQIVWPSGFKQEYPVPTLDTEWLAIEGRDALIEVSRP